MAEALRDVRCRVCGTLLFRAAALGQVEIVCPQHRGDKEHRQPQTVTLRCVVARATGG